MSSPSRRQAVAGAVRELRGGGRGWTLVAVGLGWFFVLGLRFVVPALVPAIRDDFGVSNASVGAAITLLWVTYALMQFPAGALVDRLGERRLLAASALVAAAGLAGYAVAPTFAVFLVATALFGLGSGLYGPPRGTVLSRTFPDRDGTAFGVVLGAGSIGAALLPVGATLLAGSVGWPLAIGLAVPGFLAVALGLWRTVPEASAGDDRASPGGASKDEGVAPVDETQTDGGTTPLRARTRAVRRALGTRRVLLAAAGTTLMLFVFQGLTAFFTTYLVEVKSVAAGTAGGLFGLLFLAGAASQSVGGRLGDRFGYGRVLAAVSLVGVVPLLLLPVVSGTVALAVVAALFGVRLSVGPLSNAYIVSLLPTEVRGTAWGLLRTCYFVVGAFGSTAVGAMADRDLYVEAFLALAALSTLAALVYLYLPARDPAS